MASDQIVTSGGSGAEAGAAASATSGEAPPPRWRKVTSDVAWIVGGLTLLLGGVTLAISDGYPPSMVTGAALLAPGLLVLPPAVGAARKLWPALGSLWAPPAIYLLLSFGAFALGVAVEPHGAARLPYVNRALALADSALKANDPAEAAQHLRTFESDANTNPAVKSMLARIATAKAAKAAAEDAAEEAAAQPTREATLAELQRVDGLFQGKGVPCKQALDDLPGAASIGPVAAFQVADAGVRACGSLAPEASESVPEPMRDKLNADIHACDLGYALISSGFHDARGFAEHGLRVRKAIAANNDFGQGQQLVNACLPAYEADIAAAGLKRPAPDLTIASVPLIE